MVEENENGFNYYIIDPESGTKIRVTKEYHDSYIEDYSQFTHKPSSSLRGTIIANGTEGSITGEQLQKIKELWNKPVDISQFIPSNRPRIDELTEAINELETVKLKLINILNNL